MGLPRDFPLSCFKFLFLQTPLHLAIITKQPNAVKMLIQEGASVNYPDRRGNTSVHLASSRKELGILHVLSQAASPSPDFNARNFSGKCNHINIIRHYVLSDQSGLTPVHVATKEANIDVLKFLFQVGANRNLPVSVYPLSKLDPMSIISMCFL